MEKVEERPIIWNSFFINNTALHLSAWWTSLSIPTFLKENLFCFKSPNYSFWLKWVGIWLFPASSSKLDVSFQNFINLWIFKGTCPNPIHFQVKGKKAPISHEWPSLPAAAAAPATTAMRGSATCPFPCVFCTAGDFSFLHITEGSRWARNWQPRWLVPCVISTVDLPCYCRETSLPGSLCLSFPIPCSPPSCLLPTGNPLSSPQSPGLSGGATCGCWQWTRGPQVKIKQGDYPACFPAPFPLDSKVALRVKINCLALPTESILTLSRIAYSSSHYTSAASSSSS